MNNAWAEMVFSFAIFASLRERKKNFTQRRKERQENVTTLGDSHNASLISTTCKPRRSTTTTVYRDHG
jgi:hypothetical protein